MIGKPRWKPQVFHCPEIISVVMTQVCEEKRTKLLHRYVVNLNGIITQPRFKLLFVSDRNHNIRSFKPWGRDKSFALRHESCRFKLQVSRFSCFKAWVRSAWVPCPIVIPQSSASTEFSTKLLVYDFLGSDEKDSVHWTATKSKLHVLWIMPWNLQRAYEGQTHISFPHN